MKYERQYVNIYEVYSCRIKKLYELTFEDNKKVIFKIGVGQTIDRTNRIMRTLFALKIININYSIKKDPLNF